MTMHVVEYEFRRPEWGTVTMDIDPELDMEDKEAIARDEINSFEADIESLDITSIKALND